MSRQDELVFVPLGGVGEIGMNLALYGYGQGKNRKWLAVDMGVAFGKDDLPGVDAVLPDIGFLLSQKKNLAGIAITHAHEDHFGALFNFWPELKVPVFMTPFAAGLLAAKQVGEPGAPKIPAATVAPKLTTGPTAPTPTTSAPSPTTEKTRPSPTSNWNFSVSRIPSCP